jgi:hypothetical protein
MSGKALAVVLGLSAIVALATAGPKAAAGPSRADAASLQRKVTTITQFGASPVRQARRTMVTQDEVNAYLSFDAADQIPVGVVQPAITIVGGGRVAARAIVDLDEVRKQNSQRSLLDPMNFVTGRVPVTATFMLVTSGGSGRVEFESGAIGPIPIPKLILQEIVSYYSRAPEHPGGISLDDSFELPARIREVQVEGGRAVVVQ